MCRYQSDMRVIPGLFAIGFSQKKLKTNQETPCLR